MARTVAIPPLPTTLEKLGNRKFSFYPPILRIERNEWLFREATWSELLVINAQTGGEVWIPRRFIGEVSRIEEPTLIVGLIKELEYREGAVWPHQRRVIEMPIAVGAENLAAGAERKGPAPVIQITLHSRDTTRKSRTVVGAIAIGVVGAIVVAGVVGNTQLHTRARPVRDVSYRDLRLGDDANMVQRILGSAAEEWRPDAGQLQLSYPSRGYTVVLAGRSRELARYTGVVPFRDRHLP